MVAGTEVADPELGTILPNVPAKPIPSLSSIGCVLEPDICGGQKGSAGWFCAGSRAVRDAISSGVNTVGMPPARLVSDE